MRYGYSGVHRELRLPVFFCANPGERVCYFLVSEQESNQRNRHRGGATKMRSPLCTPPAASPSGSRKCSDFREPARKNFRFFSCRCSKIGTFWDTNWRCGAGFLKGRCSAQRIYSNNDCQWQSYHIITCLFGMSP